MTVVETFDDNFSDPLDRAAWVIYAFIFAALPLAVVAMRTYMVAWHYYLAGAVFLVGALTICALDLLRMRRTVTR